MSIVGLLGRKISMSVIFNEEDNKAIEDEADSILDFSDSNPFGSFGNL